MNRFQKWWYRVRARLCADIIRDEITNHCHPDFGDMWQEGGTGKTHLDAAQLRGWQDAISSIRASLAGYPHCGGDIGIMTEMERLIHEFGSTRSITITGQFTGTSIEISWVNPSSTALAGPHKP